MLRAHLLGALERVARAAVSIGAPIAVVVVGGGPTGVETAGALASMGDDVVGPGASLQVTVVEAGARLLNGFSPRSSDFALTDLRSRGVDVRLGQMVERADGEGVTLVGGNRIRTDTVIWAAGVQASGLGHLVGIEVDRRGKIVVDSQLNVTGHPNVFAAGDLAAVTTTNHHQPLPMLAPVAIQAGRHAGEQVARRLAGRPLSAFRYRDKGIMAVLARGDAVAELPLHPWAGAASRRPLRFAGLPAWFLWLGVHIVYLIGFRNRLKVLVDWGWSYFTSRGAGAILLDMPDEPEAAHTARRPPGAAPPA